MLEEHIVPRMSFLMAEHMSKTLALALVLKPVFAGDVIVSIRPLLMRLCSNKESALGKMVTLLISARSCAENLLQVRFDDPCVAQQTQSK